MRKKISKAEQAASTRAALLTAGQELFGARGYAHTDTALIVRHANVTRGALYYHFEDKVGLFRAVFENLRSYRVEVIRSRIQVAEGDLWQKLIQTGCRTFVDLGYEDLGAQRILFVDGPAVLPPRFWHDNAPAVNTLHTMLTELAEAGFIKKQSFSILSRLLWGAFREVGHCIVQAKEEEKATLRDELIRGLECLFEGLLIEPRSQVAGYEAAPPPPLKSQKVTIDPRSGG